MPYLTLDLEIAKWELVHPRFLSPCSFPTDKPCQRPRKDLRIGKTRAISCQPWLVWQNLASSFKPSCALRDLPPYLIGHLLCCSSSHCRQHGASLGFYHAGSPRADLQQTDPLCVCATDCTPSASGPASQSRKPQLPCKGGNLSDTINFSCLRFSCGC
jgi:hypothetical protein